MWTSFIGFMASGKSSVTEHMQSATSRPLASVDAEVVRRSGKPISDFFDSQGEEAFRQMELETIRSLDPHRPLLVDTGGGVVHTPAAIEHLRKQGVVIWLDAPWEVFRARLKASDTSTRPLVDRLGWAALEELFRKRRRLYAASADFRVWSQHETVPEIARKCMLRSLIWERRQEGRY